MSSGTGFFPSTLPSDDVEHYAPVVAPGEPMQHFRLRSSESLVNVRLRDFNGRWLASADTDLGPSLGWGMTAFEALWMALEPYDGIIDELLASVSDELMTTLGGP